jgi:hypothetical protein
MDLPRGLSVRLIWQTFGILSKWVAGDCFISMPDEWSWTERFYLHFGKIAAIVSEMIRSPQMMKRRLREGVEFLHFLRERSAAH